VAEDKFDAIVVGAGPAGISAAYTMAEAGMDVVLIERGEYPGSKNVMGGILYRQATEEVIPGFWKDAPLERPIIEQRYWFLAEKSAFTTGYKSQDFAEEPYNCFSVFRAQFDRWFASKAVEKGALLITETVVEDLLWEGDKVIGVKTGRPDGDLTADVVILAEGVNSMLTQKAGLAKGILTDHLAVALKEVIALPKEKIEDRFNLEDGQGATIELFGQSTMGMVGTGFIYTNKESVSIGVGAILDQIVHNNVNPNDMLEHLKRHPVVRPLIEGGEIKEYCGHMIPEGGYKAIPKLYANGLMVVGDSAMLVNGIHREGSNLAMISGKLAGKTAVRAKDAGDFSAHTLSLYKEALDETFVIKDLKKYQNASGLLIERPEFLTIYPEIINDVAHEFFTIDSVPKKEKQKIMMEKVKKRRSLGRLAKDMYRGWRAMG